MGLIDTSLEVLKLASKIANPELVQAATRANIEALELSGKNLELRQRAEELENQVKELKAQLLLTGEVFREGDLVFREGEQRGYCSRCWDVESKRVRIVTMGAGGRRGPNGWHQCTTSSTFGLVGTPRMK